MAISDYPVLLYRVDEEGVIHQLAAFRGYHSEPSIKEDLAMEPVDGLVDIRQWSELVGPVTCTPALLSEVPLGTMFLQVNWGGWGETASLYLLYECTTNIERYNRLTGNLFEVDAVRLECKRYVVRHLTTSSPDLMVSAW